MYLRENFDDFVWVTNFPSSTRPFYVAEIAGMADDCQLWFRGKTILLLAA
ncbi:hypothetical protein [Arthrobacter polaris]|nr:hypothetical protein [Arthrobacter polaris]UIK88966.1 hypothetical protein J0916_00130 [Arthrobacter polaris]